MLWLMAAFSRSLDLKSFFDAFYVIYQISKIKDDIQAVSHSHVYRNTLYTRLQTNLKHFLFLHTVEL